MGWSRCAGSSDAAGESHLGHSLVGKDVSWSEEGADPGTGSSLKRINILGLGRS